jgi:hypothetical protein
MPDIVRVNHTPYSWTSSSHKFDGFPYSGVVAVDYEQKRDVKLVHASQQDGRPLGTTSGKYSVPNFTVRMLRDSAWALKLQLTVTGLGSYGDAEFTYRGSLFEPVIGSIPLVVLGETCRIIGEKQVHEEGIDELVTEYALSCLQLTENGLRLWSVTRQLAGLL